MSGLFDTTVTLKKTQLIHYNTLHQDTKRQTTLRLWGFLICHLFGLVSRNKIHTKGKKTTTLKQPRAADTWIKCRWRVSWAITMPVQTAALIKTEVCLFCQMRVERINEKWIYCRRLAGDQDVLSQWMTVPLHPYWQLWSLAIPTVAQWTPPSPNLTLRWKRLLRHIWTNTVDRVPHWEASRGFHPELMNSI